MTDAQAETLISSLESGHAGVETFLALSADDRATIMAMLEERAVTNELGQMLEKCEADGTAHRIGAFLSEPRESR